MAFDFTSYLAKLDPTQSYNIQTLTGGVVNITARASRVLECEASLSRFPGHSSFILKHAPPYIAGIGPEAPFSTFRQVGLNSTTWLPTQTFANPIPRLSRHVRYHSSCLHRIVCTIFVKSLELKSQFCFIMIRTTTSLSSQILASSRICLIASGILPAQARRPLQSSKVQLLGQLSTSRLSRPQKA